MRQETGDFLVGGTQNWKDMRFSLGTQDFLIRQDTGDFLVGGGTQYWKDMRFSLGTRDFLMRQETGDFLVGGGAKNDKIWDILLRHEIFSWDIRFSHERGDRWFSHCWGAKTEKTWDFLLRQETGDFLIGGGQNWSDMRFSLDTWDFLMRQETGDFLIGGGPKLIRHEIFSWHIRCSHATGDGRFSH